MNLYIYIYLSDDEEERLREELRAALQGCEAPVMETIS